MSNVAVTASAYDSYFGEAMSMGERAPIALLDYAASARMAVAESLTNLMSAQVDDLKRIKLSANWQAAAAHLVRVQAYMKLWKLLVWNYVQN